VLVHATNVYCVPPARGVASETLSAVVAGCVAQESHGRYLDLHELYNEFVNAKFGRQMEYFEYLQLLTEFNSISRGLRMGT
jgi:hypothetical protein